MLYFQKDEILATGGDTVVVTKPTVIVSSCTDCISLTRVSPAAVADNQRTRVHFFGTGFGGLISVSLDDSVSTQLIIDHATKTQADFWADVPSGVIAGSYRISIATDHGGFQTSASVLSVIHIDPNSQTCPTVSITSSTNASTTFSTFYTSNIDIRYRLLSNTQSLFSIIPEYSTDGGTLYYPAMDASVQPSEGVNNLLGTPGGVDHDFIWDSASDLGGTNNSTVLFRIRVPGCVDQNSSSLHVINDVLNDYPVVNVSTPQGIKWGDVVLTYSLIDPNASVNDFKFEYTVDDGATWKPATESQSGASAGSLQIPAGPGDGLYYYFIWDSYADEPAQFSNQTRVRINVVGRSVAAAGKSGKFTIQNQHIGNNSNTGLYSAPKIFNATVVDAGGLNTIDMASGDFNRDGYDDIALTDHSTSYVYMLFADGTGSFFTPIGYLVGTNAAQTNTGPVHVEVIDLNNDGWLDVVAFCAYTVDITALKNNGDGTFTAMTPVRAVPESEYQQGGFWSTKMTQADFNEDGRQDLATVAHIGNATSSALGIHLSSGDGTFSSKYQSSGVRSMQGIGAGDFDGDSVTDLVITNWQDAPQMVVRVLPGNADTSGTRGDGTFATTGGFNFGVTPTDGHPFIPVVGDYDTDGDLDIFVITNPNNFGNAGEYYHALQNNGAGQFTVTTHNTTSFANGPSSALAGDFNGDGIMDVAVTHYFSQNIALHFGTAGTSPVDPAYNPALAAETYDIGLACGYMTQGDFNGDGKQDIAACQVATGGQGAVCVILRN
ncbi:MAG: VCBS repeat-containing protein [Planctomycetes bacterium]|nr:VCBS repeat-containing protein [Planctomycetota bacterium]